MEIYIINGYTTDVGQWELEIFSNKEEAMEAFNYYAEDYEADVNVDVAVCDTGRFWIETHTI